MLLLPQNLRVFILTEAMDMRRSFDSLAELAKSVLEEDPFSGHLFVFLNRRRDAVKILQWEANGFWLHYKRLEKGNFKIPINKNVARSIEVEPKELSLLLEGILLDGAQHRVKFFRESVEKVVYENE